MESYISQFEGEVKVKLEQMRDIIQAEAPDAEACISYAMPTFKWRKKVLVHFAGYAGHIGFYAIPNTHEAFAEELRRYKQGKGSVQFPLGEPLPVDLVRRMVHHRLATLAAG